MTSLSYHAEHKAWQERVMRESQSSSQYKRFLHHPRPSTRPASRSLLASNPNMLRDQLFHHAPVKYRAVLQVTSKSNSSTGRSHPYLPPRDPSRSYLSSTYSASYSVPAEVRGKYARPASNVSKLTSESEGMRVSEHPLLSRPVTAGSLIRKSFTDAALQVNLSRPPSSRSQTIFLPQAQVSSKPPTRPQTAAKPPTASRPQTVARPETVSRPQTASTNGVPPRTISRELIERISKLHQAKSNQLDTDQTAQSEAIEDGGEGDDLAKTEAAEELREHVDKESRPPTATTWKTTSSQRHYIDELERLLREERKVSSTQRRIQAETQLSDLVPLNRQ